MINGVVDINKALGNVDASEKRDLEIWRPNTGLV